MTRGEQVDVGGGLSMDVRPMEVRGRTAAFQVTYLNGTNAPAAIALTARDAEDRLRFRIEPEAPVVVPAGGTSAITVHAVLRGRRGAPHPYEIELRGVNLGAPNEVNPALIRRERFTYAPRHAWQQRPTWIRRTPLWAVLLPLVLLVPLLVFAAGRARLPRPTTPATTPTTVQTHRALHVRPARPQDAVTGNGASMPPVQYFDVLLNPNTVRFDPRSADGERATQTVRLVNLGLAPLRIAAVTITGAAPRDFATTGTCTGHTFTIDNGCTIRITFTPTRRGSRHAWLTVKDNLGRTVQSVPLSGRG
jgi:hypothetical protein